MPIPYMRPSYSKVQRLSAELPPEFTAHDLAAASGESAKTCLRALTTLSRVGEARIVHEDPDPTLARWRYGRPPLEPMTRAQELEYRFIYEPLTIRSYRVIKDDGRLLVAAPDGRSMELRYQGRTRREVIETALALRQAGLPV